MKTLHNKFCNYCKTTKPVSEFYQKKGKEVKKKRDTSPIASLAQTLKDQLDIKNLKKSVSNTRVENAKYAVIRNTQGHQSFTTKIAPKKTYRFLKLEEKLSTTK